MGEKRYIPALAYDALTPLYDTVLANVLREASWKAPFAAQVAPAGGKRVLDIGCGTGVLTLWLKRAAPGTEVVGLDPDARMLDRARRRSKEAGLPCEFVQSLADDLSDDARLAEGSFDKVASSLMLHHLEPEAKVRALANAHRLLRPGGELHVVDWGRPADPAQRAIFLATRLLDGFAATRDNVAGRVPALIQEAGFRDVEETRRHRTIAGTLRAYRARKPMNRFAGGSQRRPVQD